MALRKLASITIPIKGYKYEYCKFKVDGPIATFMFSDPRARNAYNKKTWEGLHNAVATVREDDDIRVLVITGDPEGKNFCGGLNVKNIAASQTGDETIKDKRELEELSLTPGTPEYLHTEIGGDWPGWKPYYSFKEPLSTKWSEKGRAYDTYNLWRSQERFGGFMKTRGISLLELDKPVIAMVNGGAYGFGCDVAFYCDIILAGEKKGLFQWTYLHRGMVPAEGATYFLPRICGRHIAAEVLWTGKDVSARQAYEWGLINHAVPDEELVSYTYDLARQLATESPPMIMGAIKWMILKGYYDFIHGLEDHLDNITSMGNLVATMDSQDAKEGPLAFTEKRKPVYRFR